MQHTHINHYIWQSLQDEPKWNASSILPNLRWSFHLWPPGPCVTRSRPGWRTTRAPTAWDWGAYGAKGNTIAKDHSKGELIGCFFLGFLIAWYENMCMILENIRIENLTTSHQEITMIVGMDLDSKPWCIAGICRHLVLRRSWIFAVANGASWAARCWAQSTCASPAATEVAIHKAWSHQLDRGRCWALVANSGRHNSLDI